MPSDTFTHRVSVAAGIDEVLKRLQEPETWRGIGPIDDVWDATHDDAGLLEGFSWSARAAGRSWEGTARRSPGPTTASMKLDLDSAEVSGLIRVELEPGGGGSDLTVTIHARSKGLLAGMFWGVIADAIRSGLATQVDRFGDQF